MKSYSTLFLSLLTLLIIAKQTEAQVGIGTTTPDGSAILDLTSTSKGMLVPRMTTAQIAAISSPASSLLVYQTDNASGFWYFDGNQWQPITSNGWATTGNSGTNSESNFLGTTDDNGLVFKVNNEIAGQIGSSTVGNATFGYMAGANNSFNGSTFMGYNAGLTNSIGTGNCAVGWSALTANDVGFNNTAVGYASMKATVGGFDNAALGMNTLFYNQTGGQNTAIGSNSLYSNTVGNGNSAVGQDALYSNTSGGYNCALGVNCLRLCTGGSRNVAEGYNTLDVLTSGSNNTGLGYLAGGTITNGTNNTFLGSNADANSASLTNATAIGYNAKVGANNSLVLGSTTSIVKVGVGVASPTNDLSFDGTAVRAIWMERNTNSGIFGNSLTLQSGGAASGGSNLAGGDLDLSSGTSTGTGTSNIVFKTAAAGSTGTADNVPTTRMTISGSGVQVSGAVILSVSNAPSGNYSFAAADYVVINTTASTATYTLPTVASSTGRVIIIVNHGTGIITTSPGYKTSSGAATTSIAAGTSIQLISDGANWQKIN